MRLRTWLSKGFQLLLLVLLALWLGWSAQQLLAQDEPTGAAGPEPGPSATEPAMLEGSTARPAAKGSPARKTSVEAGPGPSPSPVIFMDLDEAGGDLSTGQESFKNLDDLKRGRDSDGRTEAVPSPRAASRPASPRAFEEKFSAGTSVEGRPIAAVRLGTGPRAVLFLGGLHGDEPASQGVLLRLVEYLRKSPNSLAGRTAILCPAVNPDGLNRGTRENASGVDLNRNFPARNWQGTGREPRYWGGPGAASEPETQAVIQLIKKFRPAVIVAVHTPYQVINYDGPAEGLARQMGALNGYPVVADIGYPTPGSLGTYTGVERKIATITLELPPGSVGPLWEANREALLAALAGAPAGGGSKR